MIKKERGFIRFKVETLDFLSPLLRKGASLDENMNVVGGWQGVKGWGR